MPATDQQCISLSIYISIYTYKNTRIYVHIYIDVYRYIHVYICIHVNTYVFFQNTNWHNLYWTISKCCQLLQDDFMVLGKQMMGVMLFLLSFPPVLPNLLFFCPNIVQNLTWSNLSLPVLSLPAVWWVYFAKKNVEICAPHCNNVPQCNIVILLQL